MFTRRGLPARSRVMEPRGSPTALLLSSSPVLGSAFTGNALLRSAVVTRRPAESGQDRFGLFPFDEFFAACFRSPRAARGARKSAVFHVSSTSSSMLPWSQIDCAFVQPQVFSDRHKEIPPEDTKIQEDRCSVGISTSRLRPFRDEGRPACRPLETRF
jgi:hypothetical protein